MNIDCAYMKNTIHILAYIFLPILYGCATSSEGPEIPYSQLREGDLVFRRGRNITSNIIVSKDSYSYSHIGMLLLHDSCWHVVHSVNDEHDFAGDFDRVKLEPVEKFFSDERASAGAIAHTFVDDSAANLMIAQAMQYVKDSTRFDADFNLDNSNELYCTEFIHTLYRTIDIDITEGRRTKAGIFNFPDEIIFPSDILKNKKLEIYFVY